MTGTVTGGAASSDLLDALRREATRFPDPWATSIDRALEQHTFVGTPVAECLPVHMARGAVALVGDAAHVVSPVTGAGFHAGMLDVEALTAALRSPTLRPIGDALAHYEQRRLPSARALVQQSKRWSHTYVSSHRRRGP